MVHQPINLAIAVFLGLVALIPSRVDAARTIPWGAIVSAAMAAFNTYLAF